MKPTGVLLDELHEIANASAAERLIGQLRGGLLPNPEGFLMFITTQSDEHPHPADWRPALWRFCTRSSGPPCPDDLRDVLRDEAEQPYGPDVWDDRTGHGILDLAAAAQALSMLAPEE